MVHKLSELETKGFEGNLPTLKESLQDGGLAWREHDLYWSFIYSVCPENSRQYHDRFDWIVVMKSTDPTAEWHWAEVDPAKSMPEIVTMLLEQYGAYRVFGLPIGVVEIDYRR